jgi:hypothetical protein
MLGSASSSALLSGPTVHQGVLWSNGSVTMQNAWGSNPSVTNTISEADCQAAGLSAPACPVTTEAPVIEEGGVCVSNEDGWEEPYCSGYDLALGYVCGTEVPICNHGTSVFPGGTVTIGFWENSDGQFATNNPDVSAGDSCGVMVPTIDPGGCETVSCSFPTGNDFLLMVDPSGTLDECHDLRLDNWSYHQEDFVCASSGTATEYEYEAECPRGSSALWKHLLWESSVPAGSSITFSAKVGDDLADLAGQSYEVVGTAEPGPPDTTTCGITGPSPLCPVELTDELGLGSVQGQFLSLRIESDASGGAPTVTDWTVSYTCRYDE